MFFHVVCLLLKSSSIFIHVFFFLKHWKTWLKIGHTYTEKHSGQQIISNFKLQAVVLSSAHVILTLLPFVSCIMYPTPPPHL